MLLVLKSFPFLALSFLSLTLEVGKVFSPMSRFLVSLAVTSPLCFALEVRYY